MSDSNADTRTPATDPIEELAASQRFSKRQALYRWLGFMAAVGTLFGVVSAFPDLRGIDLIYVPTVVLLVIGCLVSGYIIGTLWTLRRLSKLQKASRPELQQQPARSAA